MATASDATARVSRRRLLQMLAAAGITGPAALALAAQAPSRLSIDVIRKADDILELKYANDRLPIIERALQRNLDEFQIVRDLRIDDQVEPAPIFLARGW